jgi:hypothetical protein
MSMNDTSRPVWATAILLVASLSACEMPRFDGPQIQHPPPAFTLNPSTQQDRRMFPDREVLYHDAWVEASWGNFSGIYINGHPGALGPEDVDAARAAAIAMATGSLAEFGELETVEVDGRTAWGWTESWRLENGGLAYVVFRAAVPYDTITYAIDFLTGDPGLKIRPDSLRTIVASFAVGETTANLPLLAVLAAVSLILLHTLRARQRARAEATRTMTLITMPKDEGQGRDRNPALGGDSIAQAITKRLEERQRTAEPEG